MVEEKKEKIEDFLRAHKPKDGSTKELLSATSKTLDDISKRKEIIKEECEKRGIKENEILDYLKNPDNFTIEQRKMIEDAEKEIEQYKEQLRALGFSIPDLSAKGKAKKPKGGRKGWMPL